MQPASTAEVQPAISLLGKTPQLLETLLEDLVEELLQMETQITTAGAFLNF